MLWILHGRREGKGLNLKQIFVYYSDTLRAHWLPEDTSYLSFCKKNEFYLPLVDVFKTCWEGFRHLFVWFILWDINVLKKDICLNILKKNAGKCCCWKPYKRSASSYRKPKQSLNQVMPATKKISSELIIVINVDSYLENCFVPNQSSTTEE